MWCVQLVFETLTLCVNPQALCLVVRLACVRDVAPRISPQTLTLWAGLGGREPHFTLVLGGEAALTLCHHNAVFHAILLFLQVTLSSWLRAQLGHAVQCTLV